MISTPSSSIRTRVASNPGAWLTTVILLALFPGALLGQDVVGTVAGLVTDPIGRPVEGAEVVVLGTGFLASTDPDGRYELTNVPAGVYAVEARLPVPPGLDSARTEFAPDRADTVRVLSGTTLILDFQLQARTPSLFELGPPSAPVDDGDIAASLPYEAGVVQRFSQADLAPGFSYEELQPDVGQILMLNLFRAEERQPAVAFEVVATEVRRMGDDSFTWVGRVRGIRGSLVTLVRTEIGLTGTVHAGRVVYRIRPMRDALHLVLQLDPTRFPRDTIERRRPPLNLQPLLAPPPDPCPDRFVNEDPVINVMVLYTPFAVQNWEVPDGETGLTDPVAGVEQDIRDAVLQTNAIFRFSGVRARVTLVHIAQTTGYNQAAVADPLGALVTLGDGTLDYVHSLRSSIHADVVVLWQGSGVSFGDASWVEEVSLSMEAAAFAVVYDGPATISRTFPHELAHLMGARHERPIDVSNDKPYRYNHGYVNHAAKEYSIMAKYTGYAQGVWFSNPDLVLAGAPSGIPSTSPDAADNRKTLNNTAATVAAFRITPAWFSAAGAEAPWRELRTADERLGEIEFGDFNGDGEADAFRVDQATGTWFVSYSMTDPWITLKSGMGNHSLNQLAFADFDLDGRTDVFRVGAGGDTWYVWYAVGTGDPQSDWVTLTQNAGGHSLGTLGLGDFDGNGSLDVLRVDDAAGAWYVWYSVNDADPTTSWSVLNQTVGQWPRSQLALGNFDGNGNNTDIFALDVEIAGAPWYTWWTVYDGGQGPGARVRLVVGLGTGSEFEELAFGDFNDDGMTDVFVTDPETQSWMVSPANVPLFGAWQVVNRSCYMKSELAFADLDGDGKTDVFRPGVRP